MELAPRSQHRGHILSHALGCRLGAPCEAVIAPIGVRCKDAFRLRLGLEALECVLRLGMARQLAHASALGEQ